MKKKNSVKMNLSGFAPELHWDLILMFIALIVIAIAGYFGFVYVTLNHHIQNIATESANAEGSVSKDEQALKKIVNMESIIAGYRERDQAYHDLLKALAARAPAPAIASSTASSTASTTVVATTTVR